MTDKMRWRYGDTNPVVAAVDAATVIEIGDLLWQDTDDAKPAAALADHSSQAANQQALAAAFLGVAMQRSRNGDSAPIRVATTGVFEFDCASGTFELGDLAGADKNAANNGLLNQQIAKVAQSQSAIGRVAKREPVATTNVLVDIRSTIMTGGVGGASSGGSSGGQGGS
jgi:hypothetical protein